MPVTISSVRRNVIVASLLAITASAVSGTATWSYYEYLPSDRPLPGVFVGGQLPPRDERLGDWLEARRERLLAKEAYLVLPEGEGTVKTTYGELGLELDVATTMREIEKHSATGTFVERLYRALDARKHEVDLPLSWSFDENRAKVLFSRVAPLVWRDPVDARLDLVKHARIDEHSGRAIDVSGSLTLVLGGERGDLPAFPIATSPVPAKVTSAMLANVDVTQVLSSFETNFGGTGKGRAINIEVAAKYLNGTVIAPGQTVSFNKIVGARTLDRGFVYAPVIKDDELEPGVGGGTCQVASTVHAAAVYGAIEIPKRRSHSRPSGYAPMGLDATVIYGEVDLEVKNPYDTPLIVHAFLPTPTKLRVEFLGRLPPGKVEHVYGVMHAHDFYRRVWTKPWLEAGKTVKRQRGIKGYDVVSTVKVTYPDGRVDEKRYFSWYRPVPEVFWVGPGANLTELPELPPQAERVEVDGVVVEGGSASSGTAVSEPQSDPEAPSG
jgi:hypothetical protein